MSKFSTAEFMDWLEEHNHDQPEFLQAAEEIAQNVETLINDNPKFQQQKVLQRLAEPDRIISFRVTWLDDQGDIQINRGWRVQQSNALGPYKGGLRFHPSVNESVLKFLAFEQCFKNALTGLPMGGGKGGSDFDPKGCSDSEIMRFCQAFMMELHRHIGPNIDVPAGDINVGAREIGYLYGQYKRIRNKFGGYITGKDIEFGGSHVRTEATGYGVMYFLEEALKYHDDEVEGKIVAISGAGNVATYAAQKAISMGAKVITLSNSKGTLHIEDGFTQNEIDWLIEHSDSHDNALKALSEDHTAEWLVNQKPWHLEYDVAIPCATQNEIIVDDAKLIDESGCSWVVEGANMPCTPDAVAILQDAEIHYVPGKASNAGGVALSGLEMSQNAGFERRDFDFLECKLEEIMDYIHCQCVAHGKRDDDSIDYALGASRAAFYRLASAVVAQGV